MTTYRDPDPAVRKEMRRIRRSRPASRYGYDARLRERARHDAADAARRKRRHLAAIVILVAAAVFIIGWDHTRGPFHLNRPVEPSNGVAAGGAR